MRTSARLVDFGKTLKIDIVPTEGVTMRADPGVFPYRREIALPEPAARGTFDAGLAGLGAVRRRGRRERRNERSWFRSLFQL